MSMHPVISLYKQNMEKKTGCFTFRFDVPIFCKTKLSRVKKDVSEVDITKTVYMNCDDA